jgi:hypothetical protein
LRLPISPPGQDEAANSNRFYGGMQRVNGCDGVIAHAWLAEIYILEYFLIIKDQL